MKKSEIRQRVLAVLKGYSYELYARYTDGLDSEEELDQVDLRNDFGIDSLDILEIQFLLVKEFNFVTDDDFNQLWTIRMLVDYLAERMQTDE